MTVEKIAYKFIIHNICIKMPLRMSGTSNMLIFIAFLKAGQEGLFIYFFFSLQYFDQRALSIH